MESTKSESMVAIPIYFTPEQIQWMDAVAKREKCKRGAIARRSVANEMAREGAEVSR